MDIASYEKASDVEPLIELLCKTQYNPGGFTSQVKNRYYQYCTLSDLFHRAAPKEQVARTLSCVLVAGHLTVQFKACLLGLVRTLRGVFFDINFLDKEVMSGLEAIPASDPLYGLGYGCKDLHNIPSFIVNTQHVLTILDMSLMFSLSGVDLLRVPAKSKQGTGIDNLPQDAFVPIFCFSTPDELKNLVAVYKDCTALNNSGCGALLLQINLKHLSRQPFIFSNNDIENYPPPPLQDIHQAQAALNANYFFRVTIEGGSGINGLKEIIYLLAHVKRLNFVPMASSMNVKSALGKYSQLI